MYLKKLENILENLQTGLIMNPRLINTKKALCSARHKNIIMNMAMMCHVYPVSAEMELKN